MYTIVLGSIVLSQYTGVGVRVVTTNDDNSLDVQLADNLKTLLKLIHLLQLCTTRAYHVETARIAILVNDVSSQLHIIMVYQSARTQDETVQTVLRVQLLNLIVQTGNHIVTTRSLTTRQNDTDIHLSSVGLCSGFKLYNRHTIGVGEELLDFFLIAHTLCGSTFFYFYCSLERLRQFGLIGSSCLLQCTFFHCRFLLLK